MERGKEGRLNSWQRASKRGATSMVWAVVVAGMAVLLASAAPSRADSFDAFLEELNRLRAEPRVCPEVTWLNGPTDPPLAMPAAPALVRNPLLDQAAQAYATAVANLEAGSGAEPTYVGPTGYLPWTAGSSWVSASGIDPVTIAASQATKTSACRTAFSSDFSEIGMASARAPNGATTFLYVVAKPFLPEKIPEYARAILDDVNEARAKGATCFGKTYPPTGPLAWSDALAGVAQAHSEDMATWPYRGDRSPHDGSNGSTPQTRAKSVCPSGIWENVDINGTASPGTDWIKMDAAHCAALFEDLPRAGVGISQATPLASTFSGRSAFVTLDIGCANGQPPAGEPVTPPPPPVDGFGKFDAAKDYRISNLRSTPPLALDIRQGQWTASGEDTLAMKPAGDFTGQRWHLTAVPANVYGGQYTRFVRMSTVFRGNGQVMTSMSPPVLRPPIAVADISQYWLFVPVPGEANTYRIRNSGSTSGNWEEGVFLAVLDSGEVGFAWNPKPEDRSTRWKVEPF